MDKIVYKGKEFEKEICCPYWEPYFNDKKKLDKCVDLLKANLDEKDQNVVDVILKRISCLLGNEEILLTSDEVNEITLLRNNFYDKIKSIDGYFEWEGYRLSSCDFDDSVFYYKCGLGAVQDLKKIRTKTIIDAGGYIGDSAIVLSDYTDCDVYAFEAFYDNYRQIEGNAKLNGKKNIKPVNAALSSYCSSDLPFFVRTEGTTGHGILKREGRDYEDPISVNAMTLDSFVEKYHLNIGLIKADIEGGEKELIRGAEDTIRRQKPTLLISIYHTADDFFEIKNMIEEIGVGYKFKISQAISEYRIFLETMLVCEAQK